MSEAKPFEVDKLLEKVPGKYALALLLGRRAVQIKRADREELYPLQRAYEEVMRGEVGITYEAPDSATDPLSLDALVLEEEAPAESHMDATTESSQEAPEGFSIEEGDAAAAPTEPGKAKSALEILAGALGAADDSAKKEDSEKEAPKEE